MILTTVPWGRLKFCYISQIIILIFLRTAFSTHFVWCTCCCMSAISATIVCNGSSGYKMCTPLCCILLAHRVCINFDSMTNFCCRHISCMQKPNYCLDLMLRQLFQSSCYQHTCSEEWWPSTQCCQWRIASCFATNPVGLRQVEMTLCAL